MFNSACIFYKEGKYEEAKKTYLRILSTAGYDPAVAYYATLACYRLGQYGDALKGIADIIERAVRDHPELGVGSGLEGAEVRSVGNSQALAETFLVEAFNLKAAIEYQMKSFDRAKDALLYLPPRAEEELDACTLHNQAILNMDSNATGGFKKLKYLIDNPPFPNEAFCNLVLLYLQHELFDQAADLLAQFPGLAIRNLSPDVNAFVDAMIESQFSPEEAFRNFEELSKDHIERLQRVTRHIQEIRPERHTPEMKHVARDYERAIDQYIPVLMGMCKIYWDREVWTMVEKILRQNEDDCGDNDAWRTNMAHACYMQGKYQEAIQYYELVVQSAPRLLDLPAIVVGNLCVSYVLASQYDLGEEVMRRVEEEVNAAMVENPDKQYYHGCIVNLAIGTLYCTKGNYEFGIARIIKSLEPYSQKLGLDTWHHVKRSLLSLADELAKHTGVVVKDETLNVVVEFLEEASRYGKDLPSMLDPFGDRIPGKMIGAEARLLKKLFLRIKDAT
eukprot:Rmarinus@m.23782